MYLEPGQVIDRYTVTEEIGRGGMAVVYRVRHNTLGTDHALKVLSLNAPSIRERLIQEGRLQARLRHPNVVAVTDVLDVHGAPGLLMELVRGPSLEAWLRENRPPLPEALRLFGGILAALDAAHRLEIVHRDLKPGNVMLSLEGEVPHPKVTDFGLAKLLADESTPTRTCTGLPMGTPAYMSPEQITDAKSVDRRTDIFALGCILYELTCGQMAFQGANTLEVFNAVAGGVYVPPRALRPNLPDPVVRAIEGCLRSQREHRIPGCEALAAVLRGDGGEPHPSEAPTLKPPSRLGRAPGAAARSDSLAAAPTFAPLEVLDAESSPSSTPPAPDSTPARGGAPWWLFAAGLGVALALLGALGLGGVALTWWLTHPRVEPATVSDAPSPGEPLPTSAVTEAPIEPAPPPGPTPAPAPTVAEPSPAKTPPTRATGTVEVQGDAVSVVLIDASAQRHAPGDLPIGVYDLEARFAGGATIRQPRQVHVRAGQVTVLRCVALLETCR